MERSCHGHLKRWQEGRGTVEDVDEQAQGFLHQGVALRVAQVQSVPSSRHSMLWNCTQPPKVSCTCVAVSSGLQSHLLDAGLL